MKDTYVAQEEDARRKAAAMAIVHYVSAQELETCPEWLIPKPDEAIQLLGEEMVFKVRCELREDGKLRVWTTTVYRASSPMVPSWAMRAVDRLYDALRRPYLWLVLLALNASTLVMNTIRLAVEPEGLRLMSVVLSTLAVGFFGWCYRHYRET